MVCKKWTNYELELLKNNINFMSDKEIGIILNRTKNSISLKRIRFLKISREKESIVRVLPIEERLLCACGCGQKTSGRYYSRLKGYAKFLPYHSQRLEENKEKARITASKWLKGKKFTIQHRERLGKSISISRKRLFKEGKLKPNGIGILRTEEYKKQNSERSKILWEDEEYKKKWEYGMKNKVMILPSSLEKIFMRLIEENLWNFKYVGDGYTFIGGKCPDFINFEKKIIIEIFGNYYHQKEEEKDRIQHFEKYNYKTLIIWENEFKDLEKIKEKVSNWLSNTLVLAC